mmetsp:Transcript_8740/g.15867  ORF Transcript_8740/g.15867 Transcript_8740/m.15867 type:complete len:912 (-) Transcript_8740:294-3029(-)|eukprot:CAMPEP_0201930306 /NCGR_PEP_ID=MMETSP0903-20130614/24899_1 /ASSEMBLY_ACC=CAM_ASM_000552 /TAXON_ID=420261 /ORGANISM="Thalassiosira antarctica, Strain CCMP982" /LENGTH=911 /DNA_ID=CAMNT_0048469343 /DNA_START=65 /DNA_END=2800 /DNA_ORIENTATION=-
MAVASSAMEQTEEAIHDNDVEEKSFLNADNNYGSSLDYDDFPLEEFKEDYFDPPPSEENNNSNNNAAWVQLLNLPPTATNHQHHNGFPVGGMRRVSSCYFSIASNLSNNNDNNHSSSDHHPYSSAFTSPNPSYHNNSYHHHQHHHYDALSLDGRNTSDFLLHDVLMNVFSFLDAHSLASFSETARRPNFECFYFLELQLQRALLIGESHHFMDDLDGREENDTNLLQNNELHDEDESNAENGTSSNTAKNRRDTIPSFEGSIAGTGVISRLASLNSASARRTVQTYLNSNTSIHAMPLSHSLAYFRQVLLRGHFPQSSQPPLPNIPENMAKNARNMALFFTFLGAAYMHTHQQGGDGLPNYVPMTMPDPSEVLNEENMEAFKNMMLKVGLAGGFFKAGKTMKEKAEMKNATAVAAAAVSSSGSVNGVGTNKNVAHGEKEGDYRQGENSSHDHSTINDASAVDDASDADVATNDSNTSSTLQDSSRPSSQQRSASLGSLEDLSHMIRSHPSAIASRLYNAFSNNNAATNSSPNTLTANNFDSSKEDGSSSSDDRRQQEGVPSPPQDENHATSAPKRLHRSKWSHETLRRGDDEFSEEKKTSEPSDDYAAGEEEKEEQKSEDPSPAAMAYAMEHPFSPNPYNHPSSPTPPTMAADAKDSSHDAAAAATSFFSFNMKQVSMSSQPPDNGNVPTGCVGAYAHAVKTAASEVTRLIKSSRKSNFDALPPEEQLELGVRFIDACTSDTKLHIVKEILLQQHANMDVDRFFIGPDDTETCALHAAAFNGAERVLQFLCGGIDERAPHEDCGLCDVNVRDANGWTALHFAAGANSVTSVRVLSGHGAKLTIEASNGYTPFHWAERLSNEEVAAELERLGADNRFVGRWMFGSGGAGAGGDDRKIPFVSFLANRFFAFSR